MLLCVQGWRVSSRASRWRLHEDSRFFYVLGYLVLDFTMPSSPYPSRKEDVENRDYENQARKRGMKFEISGGAVKVEDATTPVVDVDEVEDCKPAGKVRRAPVRCSTRIATLASRTPVKSEPRELPPSPQRVRKKVKVTTKVTVKEKKVKVKKEERKAVKKVAEGDAPVMVESDGDPQSGDTDDFGEVAQEMNHAGTDQLGEKLAQQLTARAGLSDAMQVKATIRIFNFLYLEAIQVC